MAKFNFNASAVTITPRAYDPLPKGDYEVMIVDSSIKPTKAGDGHYVELSMQVISGDHSGRKLWDRLNVDNPNPKAQKIAEEALAELCIATGVTDMQDTEELHDIPLIAKVDIDRKEPDRNRIMGYRAVMEAPKAASPAKAAPAPAVAKKPWE